MKPPSGWVLTNAIATNHEQNESNILRYACPSPCVTTSLPINGIEVGSPVGIRLEAALTFSTNEDYLKKTKLVLETTSTMMIWLRE